MPICCWAFGKLSGLKFPVPQLFSIAAVFFLFDETFQIYGGNSFGAFNLRAGAAYAHHRIDTTRSILFPGFADRATANYDGGTGQVFGEIGYGFALGSVAIEPFAGLAWVQARTNRSPKPVGPRRSRV